MATATRGARRAILFDASRETAPAKTRDQGPGRRHHVPGAISAVRCNHGLARALRLGRGIAVFARHAKGMATRAPSWFAPGAIACAARGQIVEARGPVSP